MAQRLEEPYLGAWRTFLNAHSAMVAAVEAELSEAGLPQLAWYDVLWALYRAPGGRLRAGELAANVVTISRSGLTRLVDRIEAAGLLTRSPSKEDRRGVEIAITVEGRAMAKRMWPVYARAVRRHFAESLSPAEAEVLREVLSRVHAAARGVSPAAA